jgi:pyroglutamyl-peptidase
MKTERKILLTGFEPFGGSNVNPSILACRILDGRVFHGFKVVVEEIPLRYGEIRGTIEGLIERHRPEAVVCTGQSSRAFIALERVAINIADARIPYNCGAKPRDERLRSDGPAAYFTGLPLRRLLDGLREAKIPAEISNSAGTFGCNQIFFHLMDYVERSGLDLPSGFIHVPPLPEQVVEKGAPSMTVELIATALEKVVNMLTTQLDAET